MNMSDSNVFYQNEVVILFYLINTNIFRCEKTKMKQKIIAIWKILFLIAIPISISEADKTTKKVENNETASVEFATFKADGILTTEKIFLSRKFISLFYLIKILNNKILLYNESYI